MMACFQGVFVAGIFVFLLALLYICLDNDVETIKSIAETLSNTKLEDLGTEGRRYIGGFPQYPYTNPRDQCYLGYIGWTIVGICVCLLALQYWLIVIVSACWRYFNDKVQIKIKLIIYRLKSA